MAVGLPLLDLEIAVLFITKVPQSPSERVKIDRCGGLGIDPQKAHAAPPFHSVTS
jgi:hypothetical protein